jgi:hypothetical protein
MTFRQLPIGATFDFNAPDRVSTFTCRCIKISARRYKALPPHPQHVLHVGTINVPVYHSSY